MRFELGSERGNPDVPSISAVKFSRPEWPCPAVLRWTENCGRRLTELIQFSEWEVTQFRYRHLESWILFPGLFILEPQLHVFLKNRRYNTQQQDKKEKIKLNLRPGAKLPPVTFWRTHENILINRPVSFPEAASVETDSCDAFLGTNQRPPARLLS